MPAGAFAIASAVLVSLGIAIVVLLLVRPAHQQSAVGAGASEQSLLADYSVLRRPQTAADRADAGPAPLLNGGQSFGAGQGPTPNHETLHYNVRITGLAEYHVVPELTRVVKTGGVTVALFVEHLAVSTRLPRAKVTGNDPQGAASEITPQRLKQLQRQTNARAGYYLVARVGGDPARVREIAPDPRLSGARGPADRTGVRGVASASLPGAGGGIVAVVPDGVSADQLELAAECDRPERSAYAPRDHRLRRRCMTMSRSLRLPLDSHRLSGSDRETVVRYAADGSFLARLSDPNNSARRLSDGHLPTAQTPGTRDSAVTTRRNRNPATANTVAVVPSIVTLRSARLGPGAQLFFKVLLNHRGYFLRLSGGPHAGCVKANPQDPGGPGLRPSPRAPCTADSCVWRHIRGCGPILGAISCPGKYRVSISVLKDANRPYPSFGSASLTVR